MPRLIGGSCFTMATSGRVSGVVADRKSDNICFEDDMANVLWFTCFGVKMPHHQA